MGILKLISPCRMPIRNTQRRETERRKRDLIGKSSKSLPVHLFFLLFSLWGEGESERLFCKCNFPSFLSALPLETNRTSFLSPETMIHSASETSVIPTPARWRAPHPFGIDGDSETGRKAVAYRIRSPEMMTAPSCNGDWGLKTLINNSS